MGTYMHELISDLQRLSAFKDHNYDTDDEDDDDEEEEEDDHWSKLRLSMKVSTLLSWRYIKECPIMVVVLVKMVQVINGQHSMRLTWQKSNFQSEGVKVSARWLYKMQISNIFTFVGAALIQPAKCLSCVTKFYLQAVFKFHNIEFSHTEGL